MATHWVTGKDLSVEVQGNMAILAAVSFSFIPLPQEWIGYCRLILSDTSGYCRKLLIYSLGSTASRHYCRHPKVEPLMLLPEFPSTLLAICLSWALLLWSVSSVQSPQLSPARQQVSPGTRVISSISYLVSLRWDCSHTHRRGLDLDCSSALPYAPL